MRTPGLSDFDFLLPATRKVLTWLMRPGWNGLPFVGGSALALYLHHRLSEDIDLFTWEEQLNQTEIIKGLEQMFPNRLFLNRPTKKIDVRIDGVVTFSPITDALLLGFLCIRISHCRSGSANRNEIEHAFPEG
ncbi:MAG: nucleotidyl transferase AbiEii/AbiGii toxin family protein [Saprospirales bacterium]|nr:nucleotidyl transferase AbiEii/AbiGii toxin family protein [Saprospirales bacterium]